MSQVTLLDIVKQVDNGPYNAASTPGIRYFKSHDGVVLGKVLPAVAERLRSVDWLEVSESSVRVRDPVNLTEKFRILTKEWASTNVFDVLKGWRNELYTVWTTGNQVYFLIERSAACLFGLVTYGVHITGYFRDPQTGDYRIWVPRRSYTKPTYPGKLDNTVAGGLGNGLGYWETAVKECGEEAGLSPDIVDKGLRQAGVVTYEFLDPETGYYQPEVECIYDLTLDPDVVPKPTDGEVHEFMLMGVSEVIDRMLAGEFKYNTAMVLIEFLLRHGFLQADTTPGYFEIVQRCHRRLEYPLGSPGLHAQAITN